jgi:hypothetical protein
VHTLARVRKRRSAGLLEQPLRVLVVELKRLLQSRHLVLGRVSHGEPEQLVVGEPLERGSPVLDLLGLLLIEQEDREHLPLFPETGAFPCPAPLELGQSDEVRRWHINQVPADGPKRVLMVALPVAPLRTRRLYFQGRSNPVHADLTTWRSSHVPKGH